MRPQRGVAAIELAIVLPLLLALCFAATEFGRAIYTYNTLAKSVRDAARYLTTQANNSATAQTTAKNLIVYGNPAGTGSVLAPGLTTSMVTICDPVTCAASNHNQGSNPTLDTVTVTIQGYVFTPLVDLLLFTQFFSNSSTAITSISFSPISVTMRK